MKFLILALVTLSLTSCAKFMQGTARGQLSGALYTEDGLKVDQTTLNTFASKFSRLVMGEDTKDVILDPVK